jgi:hypothetical protein
MKPINTKSIFNNSRSNPAGSNGCAGLKRKYKIPSSL